MGDGRPLREYSAADRRIADLEQQLASEKAEHSKALENICILVHDLDNLKKQLADAEATAVLATEGRDILRTAINEERAKAQSRIEGLEEQLAELKKHRDYAIDRGETYFHEAVRLWEALKRVKKYVKQKSCTPLSYKEHELVRMIDEALADGKPETEDGVEGANDAEVPGSEGVPA